MRQAASGCGKVSELHRCEPTVALLCWKKNVLCRSSVLWKTLPVTIALCRPAMVVLAEEPWAGKVHSHLDYMRTDGPQFTMVQFRIF